MKSEFFLQNFHFLCCGLGVSAAAAIIDGELGLGGSLSGLGRGVCHELADGLLELLRAGRSGSRRERKKSILFLNS